MAMNAASLANDMKLELQAHGFITSGEHAKTDALCAALAAAVVNHLQANAKAVIASGSSAGSHSIE